MTNKDFIEIQQLMYRYARCADHRDYAGFANVFTDNATLIYRGNAFAGLITIQRVLTDLKNINGPYIRFLMLTIKSPAIKRPVKLTVSPRILRMAMPVKLS